MKMAVLAIGTLPSRDRKGGFSAWTEIPHSCRVLAEGVVSVGNPQNVQALLIEICHETGAGVKSGGHSTIAPSPARWISFTMAAGTASPPLSELSAESGAAADPLAKPQYGRTENDDQTNPSRSAPAEARPAHNRHASKHPHTAEAPAPRPGCWFFLTMGCPARLPGF
jgi:hypothetical protein